MEDRKVVIRLLTVASLLMSVAGLIFIGLSMFSPEAGSYDLAMGLGCVCLSMLFNVIRMQKIREDNKED